MRNIASRPRSPTLVPDQVTPNIGVYAAVCCSISYLGSALQPEPQGTVVSSVKGLEHVLQIFPQGIYNKDILCLESESIEIGPISGVFEQFVYLGILNAYCIQNSF